MELSRISTVEKTWLIGSAPDCDVVVDVPRVSGHHCRLSRDEAGYRLEDLASTNGTFVNGQRVEGSVRVTPHDAITLGLITPLPWPREEASPEPVAFRLGREPDNDLVVNLPIVSGYHAKIVWEGKPGEAVIEDLGSANGTAVGSPDRKVTRAAFTAEDAIYLGTHRIFGSHLLARINPATIPPLNFEGPEIIVGRDPSCSRMIDAKQVSGRHARISLVENQAWIEDLGSSNGTFINGLPVIVRTVVRQGDVIGLGSYPLILAITPAGAAEPSAAVEPGKSKVIADSPWMFAALLMQSVIAAVILLAIWRTSFPPLVFWLGMAAIWFGLSNAVIGCGQNPSRVDRIGLLGGLCVVQCLIAWGVVASVANLKAPALPSLGFLILASGVGLAIGLCLVMLAPNRTVAMAILPAIALILAVFGGEILPFHQTPWLQPVANFLPSRWAFEGLLLLEVDQRQEPVAPGSIRLHDVAEAYFSEEFDRSGPLAAAMALGFMLLGLSGAVGFISWAGAPGASRLPASSYAPSG